MSCSRYGYGEEVIHGRLNQALVAKELGETYSGTKVLVCGTRSFDVDMVQILQDCHFPKEHIVRF